MQEQNYMQTNNRVNTILCFICGREFGTKGFVFHQKQCRVKFDNEQKLRIVKQRIKLPQAPEGIDYILSGELQKVDLKKFNIKSNQIYKYQILPSCKYCGRTFNYQSLTPHMKGCDKRKTYKQQKQNQNQLSFKSPKNLVCCVCGQRFGTMSLKIHYPQCIKKFTDDEFRKHKKEGDRRKPPQFSQQDIESIKAKISWSDEQLQIFNKRATEMYRDKGMVECFNCKRKFFDEQLPKHQKNCKLIYGVLNIPQGEEKNESMEVRKPRMVMCVICGREYGTASINIHMDQCSQLFQKQQMLKQKQQRKVLPDLSKQKERYDLKEVQSWPSQKIQAFNKIVSNIYNTKSLTKCYICNRSFFQESLPKHLKECQTKIKDVRKLQKFRKQIKSNKSIFGDNFLQNVIQINKQLNKISDKSTVKPKVLMCFLCGKEYGLSSLKIHLPQCKIKPMNAKRLQQESFKKICQQIERKYTLEQAEKWNSSEIQVYNKQIYNIYKKESLFQCKYCHRTFFQQSLKKHIKHCQKNAKQGQKKSRVRRAQTMLQLGKTQQPPFQQMSKEQINPCQVSCMLQISKQIEYDGQAQITIDDTGVDQSFGGEGFILADYEQQFVDVAKQEVMMAQEI